jgi:hypothetical protein
MGAAAIGQQKGAIGAAIPGDAVGIGEREERADGQIFRLPSPPLPGIVRPPPRHRARILRAARAIAAQRLDAVAEIDIVAAEPAFGEHDRDLGGERGFAHGSRVDHHAGKPRRQRQHSQALAVLRDAPLAVDCAELPSNAFASASRRRRRIEEGERGRIGDTPMGEVDHETREIGGEDFALLAGSSDAVCGSSHSR